MVDKRDKLKKAVMSFSARPKIFIFIFFPFVGIAPRSHAYDDSAVLCSVSFLGREATTARALGMRGT